MQDRTKLLLLIAISLLFAALFIGVGLNADNYQYFLSRRVPKVLAMVFAGIAIAQSSLAFQTITHNRILTPSIMGFDALYMFTQVLVVVLFGGMSSIAMNVYWNFSLSVAAMLSFSTLLFAFYFPKWASQLDCAVTAWGDFRPAFFQHRLFLCDVDGSERFCFGTGQHVRQL